jgi:hypothetical protein
MEDLDVVFAKKSIVPKTAESFLASIKKEPTLPDFSTSVKPAELENIKSAFRIRRYSQQSFTSGSPYSTWSIGSVSVRKNLLSPVNTPSRGLSPAQAFLHNLNNQIAHMPRGKLILSFNLLFFMITF